MASWDMLKIVKSAADLTDCLLRLTREFPPEEQYIMVPALRDGVLSVLENSALGMARYDAASRLHLLTQAVLDLNELSSRIILCKTLRLMRPEAHADFTGRAQLLSGQLRSAIRLINASMEHSL